MSRLSRIELSKEDMKFSAGHFTIFSATERERLHGHNFAVSAEILAEVGPEGMCFDYGVYKRELRRLCSAWDERFILQGLSPHLKIVEEGESVWAEFNGSKIPFLASDVLILPIRNSTLEEFSRLLLEALVDDQDALASRGVRELVVRVSSGPGQSASSQWTGRPRGGSWVELGSESSLGS